MPPAGTHGRILVLSSTFPRWDGDASTPFIPNLCRDLISLGWKVDALVPHAAGAAIYGDIDGIPVRRFRYAWPEAAQTLCYEGGGLLNFRKEPANLLKLPVFVASQIGSILRLVMSGRYDLIHAHWILPQGFAAVAATLASSMPIVVTVHGGDVFGLRSPIYAPFKKFALSRAAAVTVNSSATETAVSSLDAEIPMLRRIPIGITTDKPVDPFLVDTIRTRCGADTAPLLGFIGRVITEKGVDDFIQAIAKLRESRPDIRGMIVGTGPAEADMRMLAASLGVQDNIIFEGWVAAADIPSYMAAFDIFIGPSKTSKGGWKEAQGLTFLEAMLARTPVIATRSGGIPDTVRHGETDFLVEEGQYEQIATLAQTILDGHLPTAALVERAHVMARDEFSREVSARRFSDLFRQILSGERPIADRAALRDAA